MEGLAFEPSLGLNFRFTRMEDEVLFKFSLRNRVIVLDGRLVVAAHRLGVRLLGIDWVPLLPDSSQPREQNKGSDHRFTLDVDLREITLKMILDEQHSLLAQLNEFRFQLFPKQFFDEGEFERQVALLTSSDMYKEYQRIL